MSEILNVRELNVTFHDRQSGERTIKDLSFTLGKGEIMGIVGESGSGKTITALTVIGLLSRKDVTITGQVMFKGKNLIGLNRHDLRQIQGDDIAMIFQEPMTSLNPVKKVGWQVEEALRLHTDLGKEDRKKRALELMDKVELDHSVYDKYPHELSGGMRQRVMIAAAMICDPEILIADEPTTALDVTIQEQIVELLLKLNKTQNMAIMFISHDLSLVRKLCTKVLVMKRGRIVESGKCEKVFNSPQHEYTRKLIEAIPKIPKKGGVQ